MENGVLTSSTIIVIIIIVVIIVIINNLGWVGSSRRAKTYEWGRAEKSVLNKRGVLERNQMKALTLVLRFSAASW